MFISYDKYNKVFTFEQPDSDVVPTFINNLKEYLDNQYSLQHHVGQDFNESPRIKAIEGTVIKEDYSLDQIQHGGGDLVDIGDVSDDSSDENNSGNRPDGMSSITTYWKPRSENIEILSVSLAQEIAQLTGASLDPVRGRPWVRVIGGSFDKAVSKLVNLEDLLEALAFNRGNATPQAVGNVLMLPREHQKSSYVKFLRVTAAYQPGLSILCNDLAKLYLQDKCVEELRIHDQKNHNQICTPDNLLGIGVSATNTTADSAIYKDYIYPQIGTLIPPLSPVLSAKAARSEPSVLHATSKFLSTKDADKIQTWAKDIDESEDPADPPIPPDEEDGANSRRRKVLKDSDDEDEDESVSAAKDKGGPKPSRPRKVLDSDEEDGPTKGFPPKQSARTPRAVLRGANRLARGTADDDSDVDKPVSNRKRFVKQYSDDEDEDSTRRGHTPIKANEITKTMDLIDSPAEKIRHPVLIPLGAQELNSRPQAPRSRMSDVSRNPRPSRSPPNGTVTQVPRFNINARRDEALANLRKLQENQKAEQKRAEAAKSTPEALDPEKRQNNQSPVRKNVMSNRTSNKGKGKAKLSTQETRQQREARITRAKEEAFGGSCPAGPQPEGSNGSTAKPTSPGSKGQRSEPDVQPRITDDQMENLVTKLGPVFESARAFPGALKFEIQLGKVLVPYLQKLTSEIYPAKVWSKQFDHNNLSGNIPGSSSFTNMLTTNGADIDRLLESKDAKVKLFQKQPTSVRVTCEFQCQSNDNDEFWLIIDHDGTFKIQKNVATVGFVNLHYPGSFWDASAILYGVMSYQAFKPEIRSAIKSFVESLYIAPGQHRVFIDYRLPSTTVTMRNLVMKRVSTHDVPGRDDHHALQITEVKTLYHRFFKGDKTRGQGFEKDWHVMMNDGRLHYEASVVDTSINDIFAQHNSILELGELTDPSVTGKTLLKLSTMSSILNLTTVTLTKIDWMGTHNFGTLQRMMFEEEQKLLKRHASLGGPAASIVLPARTSRLLANTPTTIPTTTTNHGAGATHRSGNGAAMSTFDVPGVRAGTEAAVVVEEGRLYRRGMGYAAVPLDPAMAMRLGLTMAAIDEEDYDASAGDGGGGGGRLGSSVVLGPDDSASQAGGVARGNPPVGVGVGGGEGGAGGVATTTAAAAARGSTVGPGTRLSAAEARRQGYVGRWFEEVLDRGNQPVGFW